MALVKKEIRTLQHPTEPDTYFKVRLPLSTGDMEGVRVANGVLTLSLDLAASLIQEWTYEAPVTAETVRDLDLDTFIWLRDEIFSASNIRPDEEKKASAVSSSRSRAKGAARSRGNSIT
jgi:hypothetical protein